MNSEIILEQIDVIVLGPKKYNFLELILEKQFQYNGKNQSSTPQLSEDYVKYLKKFLLQSTNSQQNTSSSKSIKSTTQLPSSKQLGQSQNQYLSLNEENASTPKNLKKFCGINKFTKIVQTQTFWITLNFYVTDLKIYDPILSEYTRANIQIGIVVGDDETGSIQDLKTYLSAGNHSSGFQSESIHEPQKNTRAQKTIEAKINSRIHTPQINGFNSLLCLKLRDEYRLIQQSSNLRLNNNQIFRWIVERYFENKYRLKLKPGLGDEIQRGMLKEEQTTAKCEIM